MTTNTKLFTTASTDAKKTAPINQTPQDESNKAGLRPSAVSPNSQNIHSESNATHQKEEFAHQKNTSHKKTIDLNNPHRLNEGDTESIYESSYSADSRKSTIGLNNPHRVNNGDKELLYESSYNADNTDFPKQDNEKERHSYSYGASTIISESSIQRGQKQGHSSSKSSTSEKSNSRKKHQSYSE